MSEVNYGGLLDALSEAVVAADSSNRILFVNRATETLLGWPAADLIGQPITAIIPQRLRAEHLKGFGRFVATRQLRQGGRPIRVTALRNDGAEVEVEISLSSVEENGDTILIALIRDAREKIEVERQLDLARSLRATSAAAARLGSPFDLEPMLQTVTSTLVNDFGAAVARIWRFEPTTNSLVLRASAGLPEDVFGSNISLDPGSEPSRLADIMRTREPFIKNGLGGDPSFDQAWLAREGIAATAAFPLVSGDDVHGVLAYFSRRALSDEAVAALSAFAAIVSASIHDLQMFERLRASRAETAGEEGKLQTILDVLPVGVLLLEGSEGRITLANSAAAHISGQPIHSVTCQDFLDQFPLEHMDGRSVEPGEQPLLRTLTNGERVRETYKLIRRDKQEIAVEISTAPFPGPNGGAVSTFHDVTEQLRLEAELAERAAQFKALLDHLPVGVAYFDPDGVCRASNGPARRILGRTRSEINGTAADDLFVWSPELRAALGRCLSARQAHSEQGAAWPDPSGTAPARYLDWRFEPLPSEPGKEAGALALIVDVTQRKIAEDQLQKAKEEAEQASRSKTQFLSAVSHDLRTPVNALSLQAELLALLIKSHDDPQGELSSLAADIHQAAANLIELVNDLLDLTRFDSGAVTFNASSFSLDEWLDQTLRPLEMTARAKGLKLHWHADMPGRIIYADRVKLGRVLINLAGNAVKFTESGEVEVTAGADAEGHLVLSVHDTGPGIPPNQRERIFDEFAQLRNPERDRTKGTGLGLAICRRLVEGVGGRLVLESRPGQGSTFTAVYPPDHLAKAIAPVLSRGESQLLSSPAAPGMLPQILLVEDDLYSRKSLSRLIRHAGYAIDAVEDGPAALEYLEDRMPALVLLDLMMPGMDGAEVLRIIRKRFDRESLPVVVLSGDILSGRSEQLHALDVDAILAKPVEIDDLLEVIARRTTPPGRQPEAQHA